MSDIAQIQQQLTNLYNQKQYNEVLNYFNQHEAQISRHHQQDDTLASIYDIIGSTYYLTQQIGEAFQYYEKSKQIREKNNPESTLVAISYNNIGLIYKAKGDLKQALKYLEQSLDIKRKRNVDEEDIGKTLNNLAICYKQDNDFPKAIEKLAEAIRIKEKHNQHTPELAKFYNNLGLNYRDIQKNDDAIHWMLKAEPIFKHHNMPNELAMLYFNIGNVHKTKKENSQSLKYYQHCIEIRKEQPPSKQLAVTYDKVAQIHREGNQTQKEIQELESELAILEKLSDTQKDQVRCLINLANAYHKLNNHQKALQYNEKALSLEESSISKLNQLKFYSSAALNHSRAGQYDDALNYLKQSYDLQASELDDGHPNLIILSEKIAEYYFKINYIEASQKYLTLSLQKSTDYKFSYMLQARLYVFQNSLDDALRELQKALKLDPSYADAIELKIDILLTQQKWQDACNEVEFAKLQNPSSYDNQLRETYQNQNYQYSKKKTQQHHLISSGVMYEDQNQEILIELEEFPDQKYVNVEDENFQSKLDDFKSQADDQLEKLRELQEEQENERQQQREAEQERQRQVEEKLQSQREEAERQRQRMIEEQQQASAQNNTVLKQEDTSICKGCSIF